MNETPCILAIDQGTTSTRAMVFDLDGKLVAQAQEPLTQHYPQPGWVEHDAEEIWRAACATASAAVAATVGQAGASIIAAGITNQRETVIVWDRKTGAPIHRAIVWQDRRTAETCRRLARAGHGQMIAARTGLVLDPYFSATKIAWILDHVDGARDRARHGELAFGTVDSWLLWRFTEGRVHATDATNASRTSLYNIHQGGWDEELLALFEIPAEILPEVKDNAGRFGEIAADHFGLAMPITGMAGDQQAAAVGQACVYPGAIKATFGTGCFVLLNTGTLPVASAHHMLTTLAYRLAGQTVYALEGSIFVAGAAIQWLRDEVGVLADAGDSAAMAAGLADNGGVYMVPAFTGLGAPYWDAEARGAIFGLTRDTGSATLVRAALEAVAYQTHDLIEAMGKDFTVPSEMVLRVDGGMAANDWLMQFLADMVARTVDRPVVHETTSLGAAYLAGLGAGLYGSLDEIAAGWRHEKSFVPAIAESRRNELMDGWAQAVARVRTSS